jgi:hypothetical protein
VGKLFRPTRRGLPGDRQQRLRTGAETRGHRQNNWLFAGNDEAAASHARLWSLIASCERNQIDPQRYRTSVLTKISTTPPKTVNQFLPGT